MNPSLASGRIGLVSWAVTNPAGMKGMMTVEFSRPISAVDAEIVARLNRFGCTKLGVGARTYEKDRVLMIKKIGVAGWKDEIAKIAKKFEKS